MKHEDIGKHQTMAKVTLCETVAGNYLKQGEITILTQEIFRIQTQDVVTWYF